LLRAWSASHGLGFGLQVPDGSNQDGGDAGLQLPNLGGLVRWNPGAALATGAILGLAFGALATPNYYYAPKVYAYTPPPPPYPNYYNPYGPVNAQHVSFCKSKYRSYNIKYNTWIGYDGLVHQCISPYY
jgi:hypothetical protein